VVVLASFAKICLRLVSNRLRLCFWFELFRIGVPRSVCLLTLFLILFYFLLQLLFEFESPIGLDDVDGQVEKDLLVILVKHVLLEVSELVVEPAYNKFEFRVEDEIVGVVLENLLGFHLALQLGAFILETVEFCRELLALGTELLLLFICFHFFLLCLLFCLL
jgi:hypothetical protein